MAWNGISCTAKCRYFSGQLTPYAGCSPIGPAPAPTPTPKPTPTPSSSNFPHSHLGGGQRATLLCYRSTRLASPANLYHDTSLLFLLRNIFSSLPSVTCIAAYTSSTPPPPPSTTIRPLPRSGACLHWHVKSSISAYLHNRAFSAHHIIPV